ncbi:MAG: FAD-dependent oxidoreductase [Planctomycetota bacterium]
MSDSTPVSTSSTTVCIVGGGPAGMVLAYLLARQGIRTTLLESHGDFNREFRGDTLHSTTMELLDELGLGEKVAAIVHSKLQTLKLITPTGSLDIIHLEWLHSRHNYVGLVPQHDFLDLLAAEAGRFPAFELRMHAAAQELIEENGSVVGVRYHATDGMHELRAKLVIGADGRGSKIRSAGGFELKKMAAPMDIVWFNLPAQEGDDTIDPFAVRFAPGAILVTFNRRDRWQFGFVIMKGSAKELHAGGIEAFHKLLSELLPDMASRFAPALPDWKHTQMLAVQIARVTRWYKPGLLLIGDAAHIMSPVGGVGINYAIQDALATANLLTDPLRDGTLTTAHLEAVEKRRLYPTRMIQFVQGQAQQRVVRQALKAGEAFRIPFIARVIRALPLIRRIPALVIGRGFRVERLRHREARPEPVIGA